MAGRKEHTSIGEMNATDRFLAISFLPSPPKMEGEEFDVIRLIYRTCATFSFCVGTVFNLFLLWLICAKTPAPMVVYSKLLMAPCLMDILFAILTYFVQPIMIVDHGYFGVIQNGYFRTMQEPYNYSANVIWFQMLLLFVCCTTIQFLFRYYMMIGDGQIPRKVKYITGITLVVLLIVHVFLHYLSDYPYEHYTTEMEDLAKLIREEVGIVDAQFSSFTPARSYIWLFHCAAMIAIFAICYGIILFCGMGTVRYIAKAYEMAVDEGLGWKRTADVAKNQRMREYNNQITTALLVQAILPTVDVLELTIQTTFPIFFNHGAPIRFMIYATIPLYFFPVLNPLATVVFVKPYRVAILKLLCVPKIMKMMRINSNLVHTIPSNPAADRKSGAAQQRTNNNTKSGGGGLPPVGDVKKQTRFNKSQTMDS